MPFFTFRRLMLLITCALMAASVCLAAENIVQSSEVSPALTGKVESVLMVGTSGLNTDTALGNKQALIGAEVRKLLKTSSVQVHPIGIKREETDPKGVVAQAIAKTNPTHVMTITVPRGEIYVRTLTGEPTGAAKRYVVQSEIVDAKTNSVVWKYTAEVIATFGATNAEVAESMVARMRADGML